MTASGSPAEMQEENGKKSAPTKPKDRFRFSSERGRADLNPYVDRIGEHGKLVLTAEKAEQQRGQWRSLLGRSEACPLLLEIGPGNGFFFAELIARFPAAALLAVEIRFKRVWLTADKAKRTKLDNFRVIHHHSGYLDLLFEPGELDAVFINHPDPWPKERHHKHRLLQKSFAEQLATQLRPQGEVWIKSDFDPYGPLAREVFSASHWHEIAYTEDLHGAGSQLLKKAPAKSRFWCADSETNYERKSRKKGARITVAGYRRLPPSGADEAHQTGAER
ncbi:MAG: hypothetical protein CMP23_17575 [Rickettsiales bacterium]|nr:hypothetical protein [Rickettsiales bacterium]